MQFRSVTLEKKAGQKRSATPAACLSSARHPILRLHHSFGNHAVQSLLESHRVQGELKVNQPGDSYEQEADRVADQVMRMPEPILQRACAHCAAGGKPCSECEDNSDQVVRLKTKGEGNAARIPDDFPWSLGSGRPLDPETKAFFEPRFGYDFSQVRIHTDDTAAESARRIDAAAFTLGNSIVFSSNRYSPHTSEGQKLLAHELTHVVQQSGTKDCHLQRSPDSEVWGGFRIHGDTKFIASVRSDLERLNTTKQGSALLREMKEYTDPLLKSRIDIEQKDYCGFLPERIFFNATNCRVIDCADAKPGWASVPNYVYLFHEVVHTYLYFIAGKGYDPRRECMATGLGDYFGSIPYNENRLRCELGLPIRPCYGTECRDLAVPVCR